MFENSSPLVLPSMSRHYLNAVVICLLALSSACSEGDMSFDAAQASFRKFSRCVVSDDLAGSKLEFQDAWLQNAVTADEYLGEFDQGEASDSDKSSTKSYIITGVIRTSPGNGATQDDLAILHVAKVLDKYKVVSWATNIDQDRDYSLEELSMGLLTNPYEGRCSW